MKNGRILVVEDDIIIARMLEDMLMGGGYEVPAIAISGAEAIQQVAEKRPDLVLMDIMLEGDMDGIQAASEIRLRFDVPVVYLTAYADESTLQRAKVTEPFGYMLKPFSDVELHANVEMALYKHQTESKLRKVERWFAATLKSIGDAVIVTDTSGRITFMNSIAETLVGWTQQEALGRDVTAVFKAVEKITYIPIENLVMQAMREGIVVGLAEDTHLICKTGSEIPIDVSATPIRDDDGNISGVVLVFRDVTRLKETETALEESKRRLQLISENTKDVVFLYDMNRQLQYVNPAFETLTGYTLQELYEQNFIDSIHPADKAWMTSLWEGVFQGKAFSEVEFRIVAKDGRIKWCTSSWGPLLDKTGRQIGIQGREVDITERKRAEENLFEYQERLRSLASELSLAEERERRRIATYVHDRLVQDLAFVKMKLGALRQSVSTTDFARPLDEIRTVVERTIQDTRSLIIELSPPILYELGFEAAVEWLTEQTQEQYGIACDFEDDGQPKPLNDDMRVLLFTAVRELLFNVVKHAKAEKAKVSVQREGGNIQVSVEDDGVGFNASEIQSYASASGGFGLFSIRERLKYLGGYLTIESTQGRGTRVILMAPLKRG